MAQAVQSNETPEPERKEPLQDAIPTTKKMQTPSTSTEETNVSYCPSPNRYVIFYLHFYRINWALDRGMSVINIIATPAFYSRYSRVPNKKNSLTFRAYIPKLE